MLQHRPPQGLHRPGPGAPPAVRLSRSASNRTALRNRRLGPWCDPVVRARTPRAPGTGHPLRFVARRPSHLHQRQHRSPEGGGPQPRFPAGAARSPGRVHRTRARRSRPRHPADLRARQPGLGRDDGHTRVRPPASRLRRAGPDSRATQASSRHPDRRIPGAVRQAASGSSRRRGGGKPERRDEPRQAREALHRRRPRLSPPPAGAPFGDAAGDG